MLQGNNISSKQTTSSSSSASGSCSSSSSSPCAACKFPRKCTAECVFAPYFPPKQPHKFASVHKIFGASNIDKLLNELPPHQREDAASSLAYEAGEGERPCLRLRGSDLTSARSGATVAERSRRGACRSCPLYTHGNGNTGNSWRSRSSFIPLASGIKKRTSSRISPTAKIRRSLQRGTGSSGSSRHLQYHNLFSLSSHPSYFTLFSFSSYPSSNLYPNPHKMA